MKLDFYSKFPSAIQLTFLRFSTHVCTIILPHSWHCLTLRLPSKQVFYSRMPCLRNTFSRITSIRHRKDNRTRINIIKREIEFQFEWRFHIEGNWSTGIVYIVNGEVQQWYLPSKLAIRRHGVRVAFNCYFAAATVVFYPDTLDVLIGLKDSIRVWTK